LVELKDFLELISNNLDEKEYSPEKKERILSVIKNMYEKDILFKEPEPPDYTKQKPLSREDRVSNWMEYYRGVEASTGEYVFEQTGTTEERHEFGRTELHRAVYVCDLEKIKELVKKGIDTTVKDNSGFTAYMQALLDDKQEAINLFQELGVNS